MPRVINESIRGGGFAKRLSSFHLVQSSTHMIDDFRAFEHILNLGTFLMPQKFPIKVKWLLAKSKAFLLTKINTWAGSMVYDFFTRLRINSKRPELEAHQGREAEQPRKGSLLLMPRWPRGSVGTGLDGACHSILGRKPRLEAAVRWGSCQGTGPKGS